MLSEYHTPTGVETLDQAQAREIVGEEFDAFEFSRMYGADAKLRKLRNPRDVRMSPFRFAMRHGWDARFYQGRARAKDVRGLRADVSGNVAMDWLYRVDLDVGQAWGCPTQAHWAVALPDTPECVACQESQMLCAECVRYSTRDFHLHEVEGLESVVTHAAAKAMRLPRLADRHAVYLIASHDRTWTKVGISKNPLQRLRSLQCGSPHRLRLSMVYWLCPHIEPTPEDRALARAVEAAMHADLQSAGIPQGAGTEWYQVPPERVATAIRDGAVLRLRHMRPDLILSRRTEVPPVEFWTIAEGAIMRELRAGVRHG